MAKLHELLAVKPTREGETDALMKDHTKKFNSDLHLFAKTKKVFEPATEGENERANPVVEEDTVLVTSVKTEMDFVLGKFTDLVDLLFTIDVANMAAKERLVIGGVDLGQIPATFLVHLEKRLNQVLALAQGMATADPASGFAQDPSMGPNVLRAEPIRRARTAKIESFQTVAPATDKHPAQVVKVTKDEVTGHVTTTNWTSLPTVHQKSEMIARIVAVKDAVVQARARANCLEIEQQKLFGEIVKYITAPLSQY